MHVDGWPDEDINSMAYKTHQRIPVINRRSGTKRELKLLKELRAEEHEREESDERRHAGLVRQRSLSGEHVDYLDAVEYT